LTVLPSIVSIGSPGFTIMLGPATLHTAVAVTPGSALVMAIRRSLTA
jgi:hypothetical protein